MTFQPYCASCAVTFQPGEAVVSEHFRSNRTGEAMELPVHEGCTTATFAEASREVTVNSR